MVLSLLIKARAFPSKNQEFLGNGDPGKESAHIQYTCHWRKLSTFFIPKEGGDNFKNRHGLWLFIHKLNGKSQTVVLDSGTVRVQGLASRSPAIIPPSGLDFVVST